MNDNKVDAIVRKSLDKDVEAIGADIQSRLTRARTKTLEELYDNTDKRFQVLSLFPDISMKVAAVFASLTFVVVSSLFVINKQESIEIAQEILTVDESLAPYAVNNGVGKEFFLTEEDLDFFENLELYQWLDSEFKTS